MEMSDSSTAWGRTLSALAAARRILRRTAAFVLLLLPSYALLAYVLLPAAWRRPAARLMVPPAVRVTFTAEGIPADPLNVGLVGSRADVVAAMRDAGWKLADPITFRSGLKDAHSILFDRPYDTAPVSTHYLWNRKQDLAFERTVGRSPRRRHHARFWRADSPSDPSATLWIGAATYDRSIGVSYRTGEVMHHIDPDVDAERARLVADLGEAARLASTSRIDGYRPAGTGQNSAGDTYRTDGGLWIAKVRGDVPAIVRPR